MITSIHKYLKKNSKEGLGVVILFSLVIGGLVGIPVLFQKNPHELWAIRVNGYEISYKDFSREVFAYQELIKSLKNSYGDLAYYLLASMGFGTNPQQIAVEKLIRQAIIDQIGKVIGVQLGSSYVSEKIKDRTFMQNFVSEKAFNVDGSLNMEMIRKELSYHGATIEEFEKLLLQGITRDFVVKVLQFSSPTPQFDTSYQYDMQQALRDIVIVELPFNEFLEREKHNKISDEEALEYFIRHNRLSRRYWSVETRSGNLFRVEKASYPISVTDEEVLMYYEKNRTKKYIKSPAKVVVKEIRQSDIKDIPGVTLDDVKNGSFVDISWKEIAPFSRGTHEPVYERAAFRLKNAGDVSEVITLSDGSSLLLSLVHHLKREYKTLIEVKDEIRKELSEQKFKKQFILEINDLITRGQINTFIKSKGVKKTKINNIVKDSKNIGTAEIFSLQKKGDKKPFIHQASGYLVVVTHIEPSAEQPFSAVKEMVLQDIYTERARRAMENMFKSLQDFLKKASSISSWIKEHNAKILFEGIVNPEKEEDIKNVEKYNLSLSILSRLDKAPAAVTIDQQQGHFVYVKSVVLKENIDLIGKNEKRDAIIQEKEAEGLNAVVASFYRNATIETNQLIMAIEPEEQV